MKNILVTGGTGFIGSHACAALIKAGFSVVIADNLSNSKAEVADKIRQVTGGSVVFYKADVTNRDEVNRIFGEHDFYGVMHFAGLKAVGESVAKPLLYYRNNILGTITLAEACLAYKVNNFIFSSSATVYGSNTSPFVETMPLLPAMNPYGETKAVSEKILRDAAKSNEEFAVTLLRYFNPVGAHESGLIGENPNGIPNNLMPYITKVAKGELKELKIFGDDYDTIDGTGVRDYIHVMDIAEGHVAALSNMKKGLSIYNLGTGRGTSVLELVKAFEKANGIKIPYTVAPRRPGDIATCFAATDKAERELGWKATRSLEDMCRDAWRFEKTQ